LHRQKVIGDSSFDAEICERIFGKGRILSDVNLTEGEVKIRAELTAGIFDGKTVKPTLQWLIVVTKPRDDAVISDIPPKVNPVIDWVVNVKVGGKTDAL